MSVIPIKYVYTKLSFHYVYEMKNMTSNSLKSLGNSKCGELGSHNYNGLCHLKFR